MERGKKPIPKTTLVELQATQIVIKMSYFVMTACLNSPNHLIFYNNYIVVRFFVYHLKIS